MLFTQTIDGVESWIDVYQSIRAFKPLVNEILTKHGFSCAEINNLTPGSNAVFLSGGLIIKIFAPVEGGFSEGKAFFAEKAALKHVNGKIPSPKLLASGVLNDKYSFQYIIMEHIAGSTLADRLKHFTNSHKERFAAAIKTITNAVNIRVTDSAVPNITLEHCVKNERWNEFPESFCEDRISALKSCSFEDAVYVHGDLKAANIIIGENDGVYLIDYADSHTAPAGYEWPFIVFGLFGCDHVMMKTYFGEYQNEAFYRQLTRYLLMHKFGAFILMQICELTGTAIESVIDVNRLSRLLTKCLREGNTLID